MDSTFRNSKLVTLAKAEGFPSIDALLEAAATDSVSPGICTTVDCDYTTEVEPDQDQGWCEACDKSSVASALVLARLI